MDVFSVDIGPSGNTSLLEDSKQKETLKTEEKSEDDYMEVFVAKELKDKITPIEEKLNECNTQIERLDQLTKLM